MMMSSRQLTLRAVVRTVMDHGRISRAELARLSGLSKQTMSDIFRELQADGWLEVGGHSKGTVGRSAAMYQIAPLRALVFGVDVGGTKIHAAIADINGQVIAELEQATAAAGGMAVIEQICTLCRTLTDKAGMPLERVAAGTVGIPGAFDPQAQKLFMVPNIAGLEGLEIAALLEENLGFPVQVGNDVNMAAKGEQWQGEGRNIGCFAFIALGTGIGMGIINEGRILTGARGAAGEISTLPIGADPYDGRTFHAGALESSIGSIAIRERYEGAGGRTGLTVRDIVDSIAIGDEIAAVTLAEIARTLAAAITAVCAIIDPERIVLGGSIGARPELLERVQQFLPLCMPHPPHCSVSTLGSRAGLYGTISQSLEHLRDHMFATPQLQDLGVLS